MTVTHRLRFWLAIGAVVAGSVGGPSGAGQQPPRELFERARMIEETSSRNLTEAIALYEQVAARREEDARLAAEAQLRVGLLYDRLGRTAEARRAFEAVVSLHVSQPSVVAEARTYLGPAGSAPDAGLRLIRTLGTDASEISLSPDGRTLAMFGLVLLDLGTGRTTRLDPGFTPKSDPQDDRLEYAEWPVLSHDGRRVAYEWYVWDGKQWSSELRTLSTTPGAKPLTLGDNPEFEYFLPVGWAPGGDRVLTVIAKKDRTRTLAWVSAADGSVTTIESLGWRLYGRPSLSPDGQYIAYSALVKDPDRFLPQAATSQLERHIYVLRADGTSKHELSLTAGVRDYAPVWTADGTAIAFASNRLGSFGVHAVAVTAGRSSGPITTLRANTGEAEPLGFDARGTLYYHNYRQDRSVSVVAVARDRSVTTRVADVLAASRHPTWSPDGRTLAVIRDGIGAGGDVGLVLHSIENGSERSYVRSGLLPVEPKWYPDGRRMLVAVREGTIGGQGLDGRSAWYSLDSVTGERTRVLAEDPKRGPIYMGADGQTVFHVSQSSERPNVALKIDLVTGTTTQAFDFAILPKGVHYQGNLSPDGRLWAIRGRIGDETYVHVVNMDGSGYRELYHAPYFEKGSGLQWSGDSRTIYWAQEDDANEGTPRRLRIMSISASGGPVQFTGIELDGAGNAYPQIGPDGTRAAVVSYQEDNEIWALSGAAAATRGGR